MVKIDSYELNWVAIAENRAIPIRDRLDMTREECKRYNEKCISALTQFIRKYELPVIQTNSVIRPSKEHVENLKQLFKRRYFLNTQIIYSIPSSPAELLDTNNESCTIIPSARKEKIQELIEESYGAYMEKRFADERMSKEEKLLRELFCALETCDFEKIKKILEYIHPIIDSKRFGKLYRELIEKS